MEANGLLYGYAHRRLYVRVITGQSGNSASHTYSISWQLYDKGCAADITLKLFFANVMFPIKKRKGQSWSQYHVILALVPTPYEIVQHIINDIGRNGIL